jgi:hypothetical protein
MRANNSWNQLEYRLPEKYETPNHQNLSFLMNYSISVFYIRILFYLFLSLSPKKPILQIDANIEDKVV